MGKRDSRRGIEILTDRLHYFFDQVDQFPGESCATILTNSNGIAVDVQELFAEMIEAREALINELFERQDERFDASSVEIMVLCDDVVHFGAISGGFAGGLSEFVGTQLYGLDISPFQFPEPAMKYIKTKLDEVDPDGCWVVEKCTCLDCAESDLPDLVITSPLADEDEMEMLTQIALKNAKKGESVMIGYQASSEPQLDWLKAPVKKQ